MCNKSLQASRATIRTVMIQALHPASPQNQAGLWQSSIKCCRFQQQAPVGRATAAMMIVITSRFTFFL